MGGRGAALMYVRMDIDYDPTAAQGGGAGAVSDLHSGPVQPRHGRSLLHTPYFIKINASLTGST